MSLQKQALDYHKQLQGKIRVESACQVTDKESLSLAYTPGVAEPCIKIAEDTDLSYVYTRRGNLVLVVTDGTAVLGLGDIGPEAAMPVMEGKCVLFKEFAGVDAFPLCIDSKDVDEIVRTISLVSKSFGGINLEDIAAPRCFEIERRLKEVCDIPVFHDDQHGTAIVVAAALINALKVVDKPIDQAQVVINGAGSAGVAIAKLLVQTGVKHLMLCDKDGALYPGAPGLDEHRNAFVSQINPQGRKGTLADSMKGADVFIGVSGPDCVTREMVSSMAPGAVVFAMANPVPEINPDDALAAGAAVVGTGRSDYKNQINNLLAFPGIFSGALRVRAKDITEEMKLAAAHAIAALISDEERSADHIIPSPFDRRVAPAVADAVAQQAVRQGIARPLPKAD